MKKALALLLCIVLLLTVSGCKKTARNTELTDSLISTDLIKHGVYDFAHCGKPSTIADLKVVEKSRDGEVTTLSVTANAISPHVSVQLAADMTYTFANGVWVMNTVEFTQMIPTPTAAPSQESLLYELSNYMGVTGSALAAKEGVHHDLQFTISAVTWEMQHAQGGRTARLNASLKSDTLTFTGYYTLIFDAKKGWLFETEMVTNEAQGGNRYYPLMQLETLERKTTTDKK